MNQRNLLDVDWSKIPAPTDDGAAKHLVDMRIPSLTLLATDDTSIDLSMLPGRIVVFAYPRARSRRPFSLPQSRFFSLSRLSCSFLPLATASSSLARPRSLK